VLGTLAEIAEEGRVDAAGVSDAPQVRLVFHQWAGNPRSQWKGPVLARRRSGRRSISLTAHSLSIRRDLWRACSTYTFTAVADFRCG
jgi:hypothetical protein